MRVVKKETLNLISCWVAKSQDPPVVKDHFLPPLLHAILADYRNNVPKAREPEVLSTVTTIIDKLEVCGYKHTAGVTDTQMTSCGKDVRKSYVGIVHLQVVCVYTDAVCMSSACTLHVVCMPSACTLHVQCVYTACCLCVQDQAIESVPTIMEALFECTLDMINKNLEEFPEHRIHFFLFR